MSEELSTVVERTIVGGMSRSSKPLVEIGSMPPKTIDNAGAWARMLIYGRVGAGKTPIVKTWDPTIWGPAYIMDCNNETDGLIDTDNIYFELVNNIADILNRVVYLEAMLKRDPRCFGLVMVDHLTAMQQLLALNIGKANMLETQQWGKLLSQLTLIVTSINALPCHTLFLAHEKSWNGYTKPALDGQASGRVEGYFPVIGRYHSNSVDEKGDGNYTTVRCIQFQETHDSLARNRGERLGLYEQPDLTYIVKKYTRRQS